MKTETTLTATVRSVEFGTALMALIDAEIEAAKQLDEDSKAYKEARRRASQRWGRLVRFVDRHTEREARRVVKSIS